MNAKTTIERVVESGGVIRIPMSEVIREYSPGENRHWFDKATLQLFKTTLDKAYKGPEGTYFVAMHGGPPIGSGPRVVKVHYLKPVSHYPGYFIVVALELPYTTDNLIAARDVAKELAAGYPLSLGQDAIDLSGDLMDMGGGEDKMRLVWDSLDKEDFIRRSVDYSHYARCTPLNPLYRQARVLGHFRSLLAKYGISNNGLPKDLLTDMYTRVLNMYGDTHEMADFGGSLQHFLNYADYLEAHP